MEITYLGQRAFRLRGKDVAVLTDPRPSILGQVTGDVVTLSRADGALANLPPTARVVDGPGEYEVADVLIAGVATSREPRTGSTNTAYVVRFEDLAICHLGEIAAPLTDKQVEELGAIDVLLVPAGGGRALGPTAAAEVVAQLEPSIVIPMNFRGDGQQNLEPVDLFCREMGVKEFVPVPKLTVTRGSLDTTVRVVVLENQARGER